LITEKVSRVTVNGFRRDRHALSLSFAGVHLWAIVPWITLQWQHRAVYGKAYLCKAPVIFDYDFSVMQERWLFSAHHEQITIAILQRRPGTCVAKIYQN